MEQSEFSIMLGLVKKCYEICSEKSDHKMAEYWKGYRRGLNRAFHGENFGTDDEHELWMNCAVGEYRKELQAGYREGLKYTVKKMEVNSPGGQNLSH